MKLLLAALLLAPAPVNSQEGRARWAAPPIRRAISVREGQTGKDVTFEGLLDALASADAVFLGESHTDETTHRVELAIYEGLLPRKNNKVVLAMEMFECDVQPALDDYVAGRIDEKTFLAKSRPWNNYRTGYRPLIERAKAAGRPVIASNFPRPLRMRLARNGPELLKQLTPEEARHTPATYFPNTEAYWRRVDNAIRSHAAMMPSRTENSRLYSTQSLWDNSMGAACAKALDEHPGHLVLHINGGFHSAYWDGAVHQLKRRRPHVTVKTVSILPAANPAVAEWRGKQIADFVVHAEARAAGKDEGTWSVYVQRQVKYRIHVPDTASARKPVPLLIWLADDGFTASDGLALWRDRLGADAAIVSVRAPYRETQNDLSTGGRWFWPDSFTSDMGAMVVAVERIWGYLLRHYPIDPARVCVAGEGTGATVVATVALLTDRVDLAGVALTPRRYAKIKEFPLPLPELQGDNVPPKRSLRVFGTEDDRQWWADELEQYTKIGLPSHMEPVTGDPWQREAQAENALRTVLGLKQKPKPGGDSRRYIVVTNDSPRARHWARLRAVREEKKLKVPVAVVRKPPPDPSATPLPTAIRAQAFEEAGALPRCPGPFGGTTVVVLPPETPQDQADAWLAVEKNDPLAAASRFHRVRIATTAGDRTLERVLRKLLSENRKNVLIVPATFCAEATRMQALQRETRSVENEMTIHWLAGLGGQES